MPCFVSDVGMCPEYNWNAPLTLPIQQHKHLGIFTEKALTLTRLWFTKMYDLQIPGFILVMINQR